MPASTPPASRSMWCSAGEPGGQLRIDVTNEVHRRPVSPTVRPRCRDRA